MVDSEIRAPNFDRDITVASSILKRAYTNAFLVDAKGKIINSAQLAIAFLKLYRQTPHEKPGQIKPNDTAEILELSVMFPGDRYGFPTEGMLSRQNEAKDNLYVYTPNDTEFPKVPIEQFLHLFYRDLYPKGYSVGLSPMGIFQIENTKEIPKGQLDNRVLARCLQIDLEVGINWVGSVARELSARLGMQSSKGFINLSSENGAHFLGSEYVIYDFEGKVDLAAKYGSALLLNREGVRKKVDERSIGHQEHSLKVDWGSVGSEETGSARVVRSLFKQSQPEHLIDTPYGFQ